MSDKNFYRAGDYVYFEASPGQPYQIRRIEELNKVVSGAVEARLLCLYRRRDMSEDLISLVDKNQTETLKLTADQLSEEQLRKLKHKELFMTRMLETVPATHIRGKCSVKFHYDDEKLSHYLQDEDSFYFQLVYDPIQKTLQMDRNSIRLGAPYQATVPAMSSQPIESVSREELLWSPDRVLTEESIKTYLLLTRSIATYGRACHPPTAVRQPSLKMTAASACRDTTLQFTLDTLHQCDYDITQAVRKLCPDGRPVVKFDELEAWSITEGNLFEEALDKYGKSFADIRADLLPWKSLSNLVEFYYMWKTTDNYVQQKKLKAMEAEEKLKQIYIPDQLKPNSSVLYSSLRGSQKTGGQGPTECESCQAASSPHWFALGQLPNALKVCADCWSYWKRYGQPVNSSSSEKFAAATVKYVFQCPVADCSTAYDTKRELQLHLLSTHPNANAQQLSQAAQATPLSESTSAHSLTASVGASGTQCRGVLSANGVEVRMRRNLLNFQLQADLALRMLRRLHPECRLMKRLGRRPFTVPDRLSEGWRAQAEPLFRKLSSADAERLSERILSGQQHATPRLPGMCVAKPGRRLSEPCARSDHLSKLIDRLFICVHKAPPPADSIQPVEADNDQNHRAKLKFPPDADFVDSMHKTMEALENRTKRRSAVEAEEETAKRPRLEAKNGAEKATPKRRHSTKTCLFMADEEFKAGRRSFLTPVQLHRMCRRPFVAVEKAVVTSFVDALKSRKRSTLVA